MRSKSTQTRRFGSDVEVFSEVMFAVLIWLRFPTRYFRGLAWQLPTRVKVYGVFLRFRTLSCANRFNAVYNLLEAERLIFICKTSLVRWLPKERLCNTDILMIKPGNM